MGGKRDVRRGTRDGMCTLGLLDVVRRIAYLLQRQRLCAWGLRLKLLAALACRSVEVERVRA